MSNVLPRFSWSPVVLTLALAVPLSLPACAGPAPVQSFGPSLPVDSDTDSGPGGTGDDGGDDGLDTGLDDGPSIGDTGADSEPCMGVPDGDYCGSNDALDAYPGADSELVACSGGMTVGIFPCPDGCQLNPPGIDDVCAQPPGPNCGNGIIDPGETCDGGELGGATCAGSGFDGGGISCAANCQLDYAECCQHACETDDTECRASAQTNCMLDGECRVWSDPIQCLEGCDGDICYNPSCGNGVVDQGEACDGANLGGETCTGSGYDGGSVSCTASCQLNLSQCCTDECSPGATQCVGSSESECQFGGQCYEWGPPIDCPYGCDGDECEQIVCGDGTVEGPEDCDGGNLGGASCQSLGYDEGTLQCTGSCNFNTSQCCDRSHTILNNAYPSFTPNGTGCSSVGGIVLNLSAEQISSSTIRFHVKKSDNTAWGAPATLTLYVGTGPTCGSPPNVVKETAPVIVGAFTQTIDLQVDPYNAAWANNQVKEFWVGKSEGPWPATRSTGPIAVIRQCT